MRLTLFHGSDDGFTFTGVILLLFVLLLLMPAICSLLAARLDAAIETLEKQRALYEERQAELEAPLTACPLPSGEKTGHPLSEDYPLLAGWKTGGGV